MKRIFKYISDERVKIALGAVLLLSAVITESLRLGYLSLAIYVAALCILGYSVIIDAVRGILRRDLLDEKFLMTIASVGAFFVGEAKEGVAVMLFFLVGEYFEHRAVRASRNSISSLMSLCPDEATVVIDGREETCEADEVELGSLIVIRPGERVPIDSVVVSGSADVDTSSITGESMPKAAYEGVRLESGFLVIDGMLYARTVATAETSAAARILELVENANERKSRAESFITGFSHFYTPIVVGLAVLMAAIPPIFQIMSLQDSVYRALIFLVISCPCALVISVPMAFFVGIGKAASAGILFKGGNVFSSLARADAFAFDKTGTLTSGRLTVSEVHTHGVEKEELLSLVASAEHGSLHPIAVALKNTSCEITAPESVTEYAGMGILATVNGVSVLVGNERLMQMKGIEIPAEENSKAILVAKNGEYIGSIDLVDEVRAEAEESVKSLYSLGVKRTAILSGDKRENVEWVAGAVGIRETYAELLPNEKYERLEQISATTRSTVYVGDGVNDTPVLARADVGIAMGGIGSDSAIEAADVVIMSDSLDRLPKAIKIARKTVNVATQNIIFALGIKFGVMALGAFGLAGMWLAVFADVGVAVLAILNSLRLGVASK